MKELHSPASLSVTNKADFGSVRDVALLYNVKLGWNIDLLCHAVSGGTGLVEGQGSQPLQAV